MLAPNALLLWLENVVFYDHDMLHMPQGQMQIINILIKLKENPTVFARTCKVRPIVTIITHP